MSERLKGFIFGAVLMLVTPALATTGIPQSVATPAAQETPAEESSLPYFRLTYTDAEEALGQALAERGAGAKVSAAINNRSGDYVFSFNQPISVEIRGLRFEASTQRFSANLVSIAGDQVISAKAVSGRYNEMIEVPVLKHSVRAGDIIKQDDIEFRDYAKARARGDTITDMASLVGKTPERVITAGRPVRGMELAQAAVVKKNDIVKMVYNDGGMSISTNGQVLSDGIQGSVVNVRNMASKKIIQATVQDNATVLIGGNEMKTSSISAGDIYEN